jgi:transposase
MNPIENLWSWLKGELNKVKSQITDDKKLEYWTKKIFLAKNALNE